jgi:hypothetical protein
MVYAKPTAVAKLTADDFHIMDALFLLGVVLICAFIVGLNRIWSQDEIRKG